MKQALKFVTGTGPFTFTPGEKGVTVKYDQHERGIIGEALFTHGDIDKLRGIVMYTAWEVNLKNGNGNTLTVKRLGPDMITMNLDGEKFTLTPSQCKKFNAALRGY